MGCFYEINDTLVFSKDQGFPSDILDIERHQKNPVTLKDVEGKIFSFRNKTTARAFQLDPVRVYLFEWTANDKWLGWGRILIQSLTIERRKDLPPSHPETSVDFDPKEWVTSGTFRFLEIYEPEYQKIFTLREAPKACNYFG